VLWVLFVDFAIQVGLHVIPMMHLPGLGFAHGPHSVYVGLLCYEADNFSYAAWAAQAQRGHVLLTDLFTTEPHAAFLFNPYFLVVGCLAWLTGSNPMVVMVVLGVVAAPLLGLLVDRIAAALRFSARARFLAVTLVLFCTGPSAILRPFGWGGIDASYFDLFPATMVSFPYQAAAAAGAACSVLLMCRMWNSPPGRRMAWVAGCGLAVGVLSLCRPYLLPCLALMLMVSVVLMPGGAGRRYRYLGVALALLLPVALYVGVLSHLPVWHDVALGYQRILVSRPEVAAGFSLFWLAGTLGAVRAWRARRWELAPLCAWAGVTVVVSLALGRAATKFDDSVVIVFGLLGAYGLEPLLAGPRRIAVLLGIGVALASTVNGWAAMVHSLTPGPERDLLALAARIRMAPGTPLVLAGCDGADALPAFGGARVFAGHWSMTLDNDAKCARLAAAGFGGGAGEQASFDGLLAETHPQFLVMRADSAAARFAGGRPVVSAAGDWRLVQP